MQPLPATPQQRLALGLGQVVVAPEQVGQGGQGGRCLWQPLDQTLRGPAALALEKHAEPFPTALKVLEAALHLQLQRLLQGGDPGPVVLGGPSGGTGRLARVQAGAWGLDWLSCIHCCSASRARARRCQWRYC